MKKIFIVLFLLLSIISFTSSVFAYTVHDISGITESDLIYKEQGLSGNSNDVISVDLSGLNVDRINVTSNNSDFSSVISELDMTASDRGVDYFTAFEFTCNTNYVGNFYSGSQIVGTLKFTVDELVNPTCNSDGSGISEPDSNTCSTAICNCLELVKESIDLQTPVMQELNGLVSDVKDELQTSMAPPSYSPPDISKKLDENKPIQNTVPFKDDTTYFDDKGSAPEPPSLPQAPAPDPWKDDNGNAMQPDEKQTKEPEQTKSPEQSKSPENTRTPEKTKEPEQTKSPEQSKSPENTRTPEQSKSPENTMTPEKTKEPEQTKSPEQSKSPERTKENEQSKSNERTRTHKYNQDIPMEQTEKYFPLDWTS